MPKIVKQTLPSGLPYYRRILLPGEYPPGADVTPPGPPQTVQIANNGDGGLKIWWQHPDTDPDKVFYYDATGPTYTDYTSEAIGAGHVPLDAMPSEDFLYIGSDIQFLGLDIDMGSNVNANTATLTVEYWNGSAWTALSITDRTIASGKTLAQDGDIVWSGPSGWAMKVVNSENKYWVRLSVSAALSATVDVDNIEIVEADHYFIYLGESPDAETPNVFARIQQVDHKYKPTQANPLIYYGGDGRGLKTDGTYYSVYVTAADDGNNESGTSNVAGPVQVTDTSAPNPPVNPEIAGGVGRIRIKVGAAQAGDIEAYEFYYTNDKTTYPVYGDGTGWTLFDSSRSDVRRGTLYNITTAKATIEANWRFAVRARDDEVPGNLGAFTYIDAGHDSWDLSGYSVATGDTPGAPSVLDIKASDIANEARLRWPKTSEGTVTHALVQRYNDQDTKWLTVCDTFKQLEQSDSGDNYQQFTDSNLVPFIEGGAKFKWRVAWVSSGGKVSTWAENDNGGSLWEIVDRTVVTPNTPVAAGIRGAIKVTINLSNVKEFIIAHLYRCATEVGTYVEVGPPQVPDINATSMMIIDSEDIDPSAPETYYYKVLYEDRWGNQSSLSAASGEATSLVQYAYAQPAAMSVETGWDTDHEVI